MSHETGITARYKTGQTTN